MEHIYGSAPVTETQADRIERKLDELIGFKDSVEAALKRLEGHPMLAKMFGGSNGGS